MNRLAVQLMQNNCLQTVFMQILAYTVSFNETRYKKLTIQVKVVNKPFFPSFVKNRAQFSAFVLFSKAFSKIYSSVILQVHNLVPYLI